MSRFRSISSIVQGILRRSVRFASTYASGNKAPNACALLLSGACITGVALTSTVTSCDPAAASTARQLEFALHPQSAMIDSGMLKVDDIHSIHYHVYGNPDGKPVLFVHGGPGSGTTPRASRFFDPLAYKIILVDQRGCGKSTPTAETRANTTWELVRDLERVRMKLGVSKWMVFGGSWGSTLSLAYAQTHPERVTELVLRGVFLLREKEIRWFYQEGASHLFPEDWDAYLAAIPPAEHKDLVAAYGRRLRGELGQEEMHTAARAWAVWEARTNKLEQDSLESILNVFGNAEKALSFSRIENHYFSHKGFFPRDGFLLEAANMARIRHIPTFIVQGRYDAVCPTTSAWDLHKAFPEAQLQVVPNAGHSAFDPPLAKALVAITNRLRDRR